MDSRLKREINSRILLKLVVCDEAGGRGNVDFIIQYWCHVTEVWTAGNLLPEVNCTSHYTAAMNSNWLTQNYHSKFELRTTFKFRTFHAEHKNRKRICYTGREAFVLIRYPSWFDSDEAYLRSNRYSWASPTPVTLLFSFCPLNVCFN